MRIGFATLAMIATSTVARAQPTIITIRGDACDLSALEADLAEALASRSVGDSRVSVVTHSGPTLSAEVLFVDASAQAYGPRVVAASTCDDLFDAIALVIVMAIPEPVHKPSVPSPPKVEDAAPPQTSILPSGDSHAPLPTIDSVSITRSAPTDTTAALAFDGYLGGSSTVTSRGINEHLVLGARLQRGGGSVVVQARIDAPEEARVTTSGKVTVTQGDLSVAPCVHFGSVAGCGSISAGFVHGSGETLNAARNATTPIFATGMRFGWERFVTSRLAVRLQVDGRVLLTTTRFDVDYMPVWQTSRFEGSAGVGLLARFL
jgi:hypothetical protein